MPSSPPTASRHSWLNSTSILGCPAARRAITLEACRLRGGQGVQGRQRGHVRGSWRARLLLTSPTLHLHPTLHSISPPPGDRSAARCRPCWRSAPGRWPAGGDHSAGGRSRAGHGSAHAVARSRAAHPHGRTPTPAATSHHPHIHSPPPSRRPRRQRPPPACPCRGAGAAGRPVGARCQAAGG